MCEYGYVYVAVCLKSMTGCICLCLFGCVLCIFQGFGCAACVGKDIPYHKN